jgi:ABC-2 type transport system permease protein
MQKYLQVMKGTMSEYMMYRLNFIMWRVRMVMQLLVTYFLWWAIFSERQTFFGYTQSMILTYILLSAVVRPIIMATTTQDIGQIINQGDLSNFLVKPMNFFRYYMARDLGDKVLNMTFSIVEITALFFILRPPVFIQTNPIYIVFTLLALLTGGILFFYFSVIFSLLGFWSSDVWAPRFLLAVFMEFFGGGLFPLDILPKPLFFISQSLPFSYFMFFPLKVYLGQLSVSFMVSGLGIGFFWIFGLWFLVAVTWKKGLRIYTAEGK